MYSDGCLGDDTKGATSTSPECPEKVLIVVTIGCDELSLRETVSLEQRIEEGFSLRSQSRLGIQAHYLLQVPSCGCESWTPLRPVGTRRQHRLSGTLPPPQWIHHGHLFQIVPNASHQRQW